MYKHVLIHISKFSSQHVRVSKPIEIAFKIRGSWGICNRYAKCVISYDGSVDHFFELMKKIQNYNHYFLITGFVNYMKLGTGKSAGYGS